MNDHFSLKYFVFDFRNFIFKRKISAFFLKLWKIYYAFVYNWLMCKLFYYIILGAERQKAKTTKKQWWRPWVDHASSRLTPYALSTLIGSCVLDQNSADSHTLLGSRGPKPTTCLLSDVSPIPSLFKDPSCIQPSICEAQNVMLIEL